MKREDLYAKIIKDGDKEYFFKAEDGLKTELSLLSELILPEDSKKELLRGYTPKNRFKLSKKLYNIAPDTITRPVSLYTNNGKKGYLFDYVEGNDLVYMLYQNKFRNNKSLGKLIFEELSETVERIHDKGYVHGDLVGGNNIMVGNTGDIKLIDFLYIPKNYSYKERFIELDDESIDDIKKRIYQS
jgi:serine/threonine protein kinase